MHILLEIFGYTGTAPVRLSMAMTSITKLRQMNMLGSLICMICAFPKGTYPVMFLNLGMILINAAHLIRAKRAALHTGADQHGGIPPAGNLTGLGYWISKKEALV